MVKICVTLNKHEIADRVRDEVDWGSDEWERQNKNRFFEQKVAKKGCSVITISETFYIFAVEI